MDEFQRAFRELGRGLRFAELRAAAERERLRLKQVDCQRERSRVEALADRICDYPADWSLTMRMSLALWDTGLTLGLSRGGGA